MKNQNWPVLAAVVALALVVCLPTTAQPVEPTLAEIAALPQGVRWDRVGKRWIYSVPQENGTVQEVPYTPRNSTAPRASTKLRFEGAGFEYSYKLLNHKSASLGIPRFALRAPSLEVRDNPVRARNPPEVQPGSPESWALFDAWKAKKIAYQARYMNQPDKEWLAEMDVTPGESAAWFSWASVMDVPKDHKPLIEPGKKLKNINIFRPELPGAVLMWVSGWTMDMGNLALLPAEGPAAEHAAEASRNRYGEVAVLAPAIIVPQPYSGVEHLRRLTTHVSTWPTNNLVNPEAFANINELLAAYSTALASRDLPRVRDAAKALLTRSFLNHAGLDHKKIDEDDDDVDDEDNAKVKHEPITLNPTGAEPPIHRVASRALAFNVLYVLTRAEVELKK